MKKLLTRIAGWFEAFVNACMLLLLGFGIIPLLIGHWLGTGAGWFAAGVLVTILTIYVHPDFE